MIRWLGLGCLGVLLLLAPPGRQTLTPSVSPNSSPSLMEDATPQLLSGDSGSSAPQARPQLALENFSRLWNPAAPSRSFKAAGKPAWIASSPGVQRLEQVIRKYARLHRVDENLVWAVMRQESGFNPGAVSSKGAMGLMQLMPDTAALLGVRDPFDVEQNIAGGVKYLQICLSQFNQDIILALAAYNAGPENVVKYQGCPPFPETLNYVAAVIRDYSGGPQRLRGLKLASRHFPSLDENSSPPPRDSGLEWKVPPPHWKIAKPEVKVSAPRWKRNAPTS
jgi:soluble lytic murein transglycosylase-like protein